MLKVGAGIAALKRHLKAEGHKIIQRGKHFFVIDESREN